MKSSVEEAQMLENWERARELKRELKAEWSELWRTKYDDQVRAEGVSREMFQRLFVDRGEVVAATRDFKPISFREILNRHLGPTLSERVSPDPSTGGWRKFAREHLQKPKHQRREQPRVKADLTQHQRKGGQGWLNKARIWKKKRQSRFIV